MLKTNVLKGEEGTIYHTIKIILLYIKGIKYNEYIKGVGLDEGTRLQQRVMN